MSYVDTHNHQAGWSVDASIPLQELVKEARDLGLLGVTLTDHYDYNGEADNDWCLDVDAYIEHMKDKRQADLNDLLILTGIELGYTPEHKAHMVEVSLRPEFDHTILSLHFHRGIDPYYDPDGVVKGYENHKPVSYTHLDVYKRQPQSMTSMPSAAWNLATVPPPP